MAALTLAILCPGCGTRYPVDGLEKGTRYCCGQCSARIVYDPSSAVAVEPGPMLPLDMNPAGGGLTIAPDTPTNDMRAGASGLGDAATERVDDGPGTERVTATVASELPEDPWAGELRWEEDATPLQELGENSSQSVLPNALPDDVDDGSAWIMTGNDHFEEPAEGVTQAPRNLLPARGAGAQRSLGGVGHRAAPGADGEPGPWMFSRYEIQEEVGRGGMGIVYRAIDPTLKRTLAIKTLIGGPGAEGSATQRFEREAITIAKLSHPNIVPVYEYGQFEGTRFLTMEFVQGSTLIQLAKGAKGNVRFAVQTIAKVARALHYAHERGIVHRDLKPANIMIDQAREPWVMDFGLAKDVDADSGALSRTGDIMGTPNYMAPEQADGRIREIDRRSDVFSLGAILYELVTGAPPFGGSSLAETLRQVLYEDPPPMRTLNPDIDSDLEAVTLHALEKLAEDRYQTAADFASDLEAYAGGDSIVVQQPSMATRVSRRMMRPRRALVAVVMGLMAVALVASGAMWALRDPLSDYRDRLADPNDAVRLRGVQSLEADLVAGRLAVVGPGSEGDVLGLLLQAVEDEEPDVREAALEALEQAGPSLRDHKGEKLDNRISEAVASSFDDRWPVDVRLAAFGAAESAYLRAVQRPLIKIAHSPFEPQRVQLRAVEVLGEIGRVTAMPALLTVQARGGVYRVQARQAILRIEERGQGGVDENPESFGMGDLPNEMRDMAVSLSHQRDRQAEALEELGFRDSPEDELVVLKRDLDQGNQAEKISALAGLAERGVDENFVIFLARLSDPDPAVARAAALVLAGHGGEDVSKSFGRLLLRGDTSERTHVAYGLGELGGREAMDALIDALAAEKHPDVRIQIVRSLGRVGERMAVPHLIGLLEDPDSSMRREARASLAHIAGQDVGASPEAWLQWWKNSWKR